MPIRIISTGASVILDEEDEELVDQFAWHIYPHKPTMKPFAARGEDRYRRRHRISLHRSVAVRADPSLVKRKFKVYPRNGDYLDCRRENLEIALARKKRGAKPIEPRAIGWEVGKFKGTREPPPASPLWAGGITLRQSSRFVGGQRQRRFRVCRGGIPID